MKVYTIGHSTRNFEEFLNILKKFNILVVIDVRRFPSSRKFPWFNKENLEKELTKNKIEYIHFPELGGYRNEGYEAFSKSEFFFQGLDKLIKLIDKKISAILCSEILWWRCHRRYIANALVEKGFEVIHVLDEEKTQEHKPKEKEIEEKMKLKVWCDKKPRNIKKNEKLNFIYL
ncbi:MAG: DUF488 domain-containing protein [Candidatus Aenigmatarchaeota archaeon]